MIDELIPSSLEGAIVPIKLHITKVEYTTSWCDETKALDAIVAMDMAESIRLDECRKRGDYNAERRSIPSRPIFKCENSKCTMKHPVSAYERLYENGPLCSWCFELLKQQDGLV